MIKKTKETITREIKTRYCDICGKEIYMDYFSGKCILCKRDICQEHAIIDPDDIGGDYNDYICTICKEISAPYYKKMKEIEEESDEKIGEIYNEMRKKSLDNFKKK